jgi:hypothetical protein
MLLAAAQRAAALALPANGKALPVALTALAPVSRRARPAHELQWHLQP